MLFYVFLLNIAWMSAEIDLWHGIFINTINVESIDTVYSSNLSDRVKTQI